ncbi:helix-turn-helix domain-containing protein [Candidatus Pacearchaeota archaeon]|nr:helix-turn-helix domain-containing protein [Candidatus Pacearchaeota archaeon]
MWVLKMRLSSEKQFLGGLAMKHNVSLTGYPLSYWKDRKWLYLVAAGFIFGEEKNKKALIKDIKKSKELVNIEINGDFAIMIIKQPLFSEAAYDPRIIRLTPVVINKTGYHIWDMASFDRKLLVKVLNFAEKYLDGKVIKFCEEKVSNIQFTHLLPELTKNQKKAMELAINKGYYNYPKQVKMEKLARIMGISYSTYQAHLKKAEGKLLPSIFEQL